MKNILLLLLAIPIVSGCAIYPYPVYSSLGDIDVSTTGSVLETSFVCPKDPNSFTLAFHDAKGQAREFCANPDWPIILQLSLVEKESKTSVLKETLTEKQMQFTNWQVPSTSVVFDLPYLKKLLRPGEHYILKLETEKGAEELPQGELFLYHSVPSKKEKEASNKISHGIVANAPNREN